MASKLPPVKNAGFTFRIPLFAQADDQIIAAPTIASGDFTTSGDGGAFGNLGTTPTVSPAGGGAVLVTLSAAEMNFDEVVVKYVDAAGDEWHSGMVTIQTIASGQQFDDLSTLDAAAVNAEADTALADYDAPTKAELDSGLAALNDLTAAQVNAEVDTALADYDAPTKAELDSGLAALNDVDAAAILAGTVEGSITLQEALRVLLSFVAGETTGGNTSSITFKSQDGNTNRIVMTVDSDGDRSAVVVDGS